MSSVKLFLRDHVSFIIFELVLIIFITTIYWLDGFRNSSTAIYSLAISLVLLASFLIVRFIPRQRYYRKIIRLPETLEDVLQKNASTAEAKYVERYIQQLYKLYQREVQELYANQKRHDEFMNQWVHQMKTPIAVIELLLQEEGELDKHSLQEEIDRLKRGLEMVLVNARLERFEDDMHVEQVNVRELITSIINENKRLFITNRVYPVIEVDEQLIVASDSKWLRFVISQFVTNAVKYTFEQNKKIYITATTGDEVALTIRDEGIGIPKSDLSRVTKAFFTGENGRKTGESTGMGLYLAQEVCEKLGHGLVITSNVGEGTAVTVTFKGELHDEHSRA
ncbi:Sensor histidine kinase GraS [Metalysinibacillus saudimassiliensis]|uniref:histidine kinase n=1 Tax=Metalysinibacillus saudimassiliensis TaxID=1461583 RepID=A0A078MC17_9BACL|nr:Sensor histidine kinase GraS [Metalysinibacillus saudimassiliensis]